MDIEKMENITNFLRFFTFYTVLQYFVCDGLNIPLDELMAQNQIHCYETLLCLQPLEYCSSIYHGCRPCTADVCALRGSTSKVFPLQCSRNCSITDALQKSAQFSNFIQDHPYVWFILLVTSVPLFPMAVAGFFKFERIKACIGRILRRLRGKPDSCRTDALPLEEKANSRETQTDCPSSETKGIQCPEIIENSGASPYCEGKLKGTCVTNDDVNVTILTSTSKEKFDDTGNIVPRPELPASPVDTGNRTPEAPVHFVIELSDPTAPPLNMDTFETNTSG